jgi:hypothetical protein
MDQYAEGWDWAKFPVRVDPLTQRKICEKCWNGQHGDRVRSGKGFRLVPGCRHAECDCACYEEAKAALQAKADDKDKDKEAVLADPNNPLTVKPESPKGQ